MIECPLCPISLSPSDFELHVRQCGKSQNIPDDFLEDILSSLLAKANSPKSKLPTSKRHVSTSSKEDAKALKPKRIKSSIAFGCQTASSQTASSNRPTKSEPTLETWQPQQYSMPESPFELRMQILQLSALIDELQKKKNVLNLLP